MKPYSIIILRISLAIVFLYFGISQILSPDDWVDYLPNFIINNLITPTNLVVMNGIMEITFGIFLALGFYTKLSSLVLFIHLIGISLSIGFNPIGIRDFGLAAATFAIFLSGPGNYSLDKKFTNKTKFS